MSKCKPALDGEKITGIQVKTKARETLPKDAPKPESSDKSKHAAAAASQQSK